MDFKKITRNPLFYVLIIGVFLIVGFSLISSLNGAKQISTQEGLELLAGDTVTEVVNTDGDQRDIESAVFGRHRVTHRRLREIARGTGDLLRHDQEQADHHRAPP